MAEEGKNQPVDLPQLQAVILGGENLRSADCESWFNNYPDTVLINEYGPTETTGNS